MYNFFLFPELCIKSLPPSPLLLLRPRPRQVSWISNQVVMGYDVLKTKILYTAGVEFHGGERGSFQMNMIIFLIYFPEKLSSDHFSSISAQHLSDFSLDLFRLFSTFTPPLLPPSPSSPPLPPPFPFFPLPSLTLANKSTGRGEI